MTPLVLFVLTVLAFASFATIHVIVCWRLLRVGPWWHAPLAFFVPVLAPYFSLRAQRRAAWITWCVALAVYVVAFALAARV